MRYGEHEELKQAYIEGVEEKRWRAPFKLGINMKPLQKLIFHIFKGLDKLIFY